MKIEITQKNFKEIEDLLAKVQGRSKVNLVSLRMILDKAFNTSLQLQAYGSAAEGCSYRYCEGGAEKEAYKYSRNATSMTILYSNGKCFLTELSRDGYSVNDGYSNSLILTDQAKIRKGYMQGLFLLMSNLITSGKNKKLNLELLDNELKIHDKFIIIGIFQAFVQKGLISPDEAILAMTRNSYQVSQGLDAVSNDVLLTMLPPKYRALVAALCPGVGLKFVRAIYDQIAHSKNITSNICVAVNQEFAIPMEELLAA